MNEYYVTCTYYERDDSTTTQTLTFYTKAVNKNDAFLNAVAKIYALFSGGTSRINSIGVAAV